MPVADDPLVGLGYSKPSAERRFLRLGGELDVESSAVVAEEVPIALVYNGRPHVVVMGTPADLEDLATGFSLTERIVADRGSIVRTEIVRASHGIELQIEIPAADAAGLEGRTRALAARTGCGLCGVDTIAEALRVPAQVGRSLSLRTDVLWRVTAELARLQALNNATNAVHAAGWATPDGELRCVREDVGRHNALDKVLGALARQGLDAHDGFLIITSRASYEMVQKAAVCGVEIVAAISRPTGLAIRFAEAAGITLLGLVRGRTANVYCGSERMMQ